MAKKESLPPPDGAHNPDDPIDPRTETPTQTWWQRLLAIVLIVFVLGGGIAAFRHMLATRPKAGKGAPPRMQAVARVMEPSREDAALRVEAMGTVVPARRLELRPRVSGTVAFLHPDFIPGGRIGLGELLATLDERDFELELSNRRAALEKALMDLRIEEGSQRVAKKEWELLRGSRGIAADKNAEQLALRMPQLAQAKAAVTAAQAALEKAELDLGRTRIAAPFNAVVLERTAEIGAQVSSSTTIATLAGSDVFWVRLNIPQAALDWLELPDPERPGSLVEIHAGGADAPPRQGRLLRLQGELEGGGLMAQLLVAVDDPLSPTPEGAAPLLLGSVVRAEVQGRVLEQVTRIPRTALGDDGQILLAGPDDRLLIRPVTPVWSDERWVYLDEGLGEGDRLIVSQLANPVAGMELRVMAESDKGQ